MVRLLATELANHLLTLVDNLSTTLGVPLQPEPTLNGFPEEPEVPEPPAPSAPAPNPPPPVPPASPNSASTDNAPLHQLMMIKPDNCSSIIFVVLYFFSFNEPTGSLHDYTSK